MTFDDHHNHPPRVWCARGMRKPKPGCCWARRLLFDRHSRRPLLVAEKKGLHRLQWMRTFRFMSFFSKRFRALDAQIGQHFWCDTLRVLIGKSNPAATGPTSSEDLTRVKPSEDLPSNCMFGINTHLPSCCALRLGLWQEVAEMIRIHLFSIWGTRTDDSQLGLLCDLLQFAAPKLPRKWKVIPKLEGRHYRSLQNWQTFSQFECDSFGR